MRRMLIVVFVLISSSAYADFLICNKSESRAMSVAWAFQRSALFSSPYDVGGWEHIPPDRCEYMGRGDLAGATVWVHAVSHGVILTRGKRAQFSRLHHSDQQFCISDQDFSYSHRDAGATRNCDSGRYLAPFPVMISHTDDLADLSIDMNPDEFIVDDGAGSTDRGPKLPDLYGALAVDSNGIFYASFFDDSAAIAQRGVLEYCASQQSNDSPCRLETTFKNQCIAVAQGASKQIYTVFGQPEWDSSQTLSEAMSRCQRSEGEACVETIKACSTYPALSAHKKAREQEVQQQILGWLGNALRGTWGALPSIAQPTPPANQAVFEPLVQICTPLLVDSKGRFLPAAQAAIDNGDMAHHFQHVDETLDTMKADRNSALNIVHQEHIQLIIPSYTNADKTPRVAATAAAAELHCPDNHRQSRYVLKEWLKAPGMSPRGLSER